MLEIIDVQNYLKIGKNKAYKLINESDFPKIQIGRKILIPEKQFEEYLNRRIGHKIEL